MKKILILIAIVGLFVSCGSANELIKNSATYSRGASALVVTPVQADVQVIGTKKINYFMEVNESVSAGGLDNVIATAVKEALDVNGGDVLLGLETQVKYDDRGQIESINITGFPGKFVNFRLAKDLPPVEAKPEEKGGHALPLFGKKK